MNQKAKLKKTEIGEIPEDWEVKTAETFCERVTDGTHASPKKKIKGKFLITSRHLKQNKLDFNNSYFISEEDFEEVNKRSKVDQFDILFSMIGTVGETYQERSDNIRYAIKNVGLFKFGGHQKESDWFLYWLKSPIAKDYIQTRQAGSTQQYLTLEALRKFPLAIPKNPKEQHQIAKILSDLDSKIELLQKQNQTLEKIGQSLFKYWFVDFEFPNEKGKPYKSSGGEMVDNEELDKEIPKGWGVSKLEDYGTFKNGINYLRSETGDTDFFIANVRDIANNKLLLKCSLGNIKLNMKKAQDYLLKDKDILIARSASPGEVSLVLGNLDKVIYSGFSIRYRLNNPNNYLYIFLILQGLKGSLSNFAVGTTLQSVNQETLKNMKFIIPSDKILREFNKIIGQILIRTYNNLIQSQNLSQILDSLLPKLMSGKIRVPVEVK